MEEKFRKEVLIFPERLLSDDTVVYFLRELKNVRGITKITFHGPTYYRRTLEVDEESSFKLDVKVGRIWIEIDDDEVIGKIKEVAERTLMVPYLIDVGRYTKYRKTLTDHLQKNRGLDDIGKL
jgi:methyl coenzyme M reductase subunit D